MKRTMVRLSIALALLLTTLLPMAVPQETAAQGTLPITRTRVSANVSYNKIPRLALSATDVHATWKSGPALTGRTAYNVRSESGTAWPTEEFVGGRGDSSYQVSSIAVNPTNGVPHLIWGEGEHLYYSRKDGANWTTPVIISTDRKFPHYPKLTVAPNGSIWAIWAAEPRGTSTSNIVFRYSLDNGATWLPSREGLLDDREGKGPWITADRNNGVHAVWWRAGGIWYARWTGTQFAIEGIPSGGFNAEPSVTVDPSNNVHVAWRRQSGFAKWDVYYATRPVSGGAWTFNNIFAGDNINRPVVIHADEQNGLHLAWYEPSSGAEILYTTRPPNGSWLNPPLNVSADPGRLNINVDVVGRRTGDGVRAHLVYETWLTGSDTQVVIDHALIGTVSPPIGATPQIEDGGPVTGGKQNLTVRFNNVVGNPNQVRWRWGAPPDDANTDSNGWQTLNQTNGVYQTTVAVPTGINPNICPQVTLFTQVRNTTTATDQVRSASITLDLGIQAAYRAINPYSSGKATRFTPLSGPADAELASNYGADGGDPNHTRIPGFYLEIDGPNECSALQSFAVGTAVGNLGNPTGILNNKFANIVSFPNPGNAQPGPNPIVVQIRDRLNNFVNLERTFIYDNVRPVLNAPPPNPVSEGFSVVSQPEATLLASLTVSDAVSVTDTTYRATSGRQYWGLWIANSRTAVTDPTGINSPLTWTPVGLLPQTGNSFTLKNWSLATNLLGQVGTGRYYVYVRFLDGAGNPTDGYLVQEVNLDTVTLPTVRFPLIRR